MTTKSHNAKKPKLAGHPGSVADSDPAAIEGAPAKHKMSFAQHQHELQAEHAAAPLPVPDAHLQHLKSDAQQHQQKSGSHR